MKLITTRTAGTSLPRLLIFALCVTASLGSTIIQAQTGTALSSLSGYTVQPANVGAHAASLADAAVADAFDVSAMYWNPASLTYLRDYKILVNHAQEQLIKGMDESITIPFRLGKTQSIGMGLSVTHVGYVGNTSLTPYRAMQFGYDVGYAQELIPTLSVGMTVSGRYAHTSVANQWGFSSSIGMFYIPAPNVSYGVSFAGLGTGIEYTDVQGTTVVQQAHIPRILQVGASMRFPEDARIPEFTFSVANEKVFGESGLRYKGGIELSPWSYLALRGGYVVEPSVRYARFGWGFRTDRVQLDFSISPSAFTDQSIQISVLIGWWLERAFTQL